MRDDFDLTLPEKVLLLHLNEETGHIQEDYLPSCLILSVLMELALRERISLTDGVVHILDSSPTGMSAPDFLLHLLSQSYADKAVASLCQRTDIAARIKAAVMDYLIERGILTLTDQRYLWVLHRKAITMADRGTPAHIRHEIKEALSQDQEVAPSLALLIALLRGSKALDMALSADEMAECETRIDTLIASIPTTSFLCGLLSELVEAEERKAETDSAMVLESA